MHAAVGQHQQRQLAAAEVLARCEDVGVELERVARAARRRVRLVGQWRPVDPDLLDDGQVADALEPEHVVDQLLEHIEPVVQVVVGPDQPLNLFQSLLGRCLCPRPGGGEQCSESRQGHESTQ